MDETWNTRLTLIQRAKGQDELAWKEFTEFYKKLIYYILNRLNVPLPEIEDLTQEILLKLWRGLKSYEPGQCKFRTWLSTVIRNTAYTHLNKANSYNNMKHDLKETQGDTTAYTEPEMDKVIDREWKLYLSNMAMERLSKTFSENIITAFKMGLEGVSAEDSAEQLGMTVRSIYSLRSRVKKVFLREVRTLMEEYEE